MILSDIHATIENELDDQILSQSPVHGGDINQAQEIRFKSGKKAFLKWNEKAPDTMFEAEAKGLELLRSVETKLIIPEVLSKNNSFLLLGWIEEGGGAPNSTHDFGVQLAKLHQSSNKQFGLDQDNFIGRLPQSNTPHSNWADFFALERIEPQIKMGVESDKLTRSVLRDAEQLYKKLGSIFPQEKPALLHGDLWSGNYMITRSGQTSIYDPAVYFGHREMDIAMTRLFGGFSADFYNGYNSEFPLEAGFESRVNLCNLYPVLVHVNLFGGSYCRQAENIIKSYV
ncbi:MAG: fructosamine kinase family protein [Gracilimonas sp.]